LGMELRSVVDRNGHVPYYADVCKMYLVTVRCAFIDDTKTSIFIDGLTWEIPTTGNPDAEPLELLTHPFCSQ
jgi:hypothetical protein